MLVDQFSPERFRRSLAHSRARRDDAERLRRRWRVPLPSASASLLVAAVLLGGTIAQIAVAHPTASGGAIQPAGTMLKLGSRGPAVVALQRRLGISADGVFGRQTQRAVKAFQRRHGLVADGIVGPRTAAALGLRLTGGAASGSPANGGSLSAILARIAACESGGNPRAVSANGLYRGKYQFSRETWRGLGGTGDPAMAPEHVQDQMAAKLYRQVGGSAWPACSRR